MGVATIEEVEVEYDERVVTLIRRKKMMQLFFAGIRDPRTITDEERLQKAREKEPDAVRIVEVRSHWKDAG